MHTDKELLAYFYQERNVERLEKLIAELPYIDEEDGTLIESITGVEEANHILDNISYPRVQKILCFENIEKPELRLYDSDLFQKKTNHLLLNLLAKNCLISGLLGGISFAALGAVTGILIYDIRPDAPQVFATVGATVGSFAGSFLSVPLSLLEHKANHFLTRGMAEIENNNIYLKSNSSYAAAIHILSHELTHRATAKTSLELFKQEYISEGLAEAVAFEVYRREKKEIEQPFQVSLERSRLIESYNDLIKKLKIKNNKYEKHYKNDDIYTKIFRAISSEIRKKYFIGYAAIRLLQEEKGVGAFREILDC